MKKKKNPTNSSYNYSMGDFTYTCISNNLSLTCESFPICGF